MYLNIAAKATHLRELGMSDKAIGRALGVSDKTVSKAIAAASSSPPYPKQESIPCSAGPPHPGEHPLPVW